MERLKGKTALVTGAADGLGKAMAKRLASEGANVVITDIQTDIGRATAKDLGVTFIEQDICDEDRWPAVIGEVEDRFRHLHVLVNNAGIHGPLEAASPEHTSLESWRKIFAVNVEGVFMGSRAAISAMRRAGSGSIINLSSVMGLLASPNSTAYGASKAAVRQLTKSVAQYCAEQKLKVRCNSVHPGGVLTPLLLTLMEEIAQQRGITQEEVIEEARRGTPMGEMPTPEDIAAAVAFLASDDSRHMTGAEMIVDGGLVHCDTYQPPPKTQVTS